MPDPTTARRSGSSVVDWAFYREGKRHVGSESLTTAIGWARAGDGFVWIGLYEPGAAELSEVAQEFGLHPLAVEDALHAHQRPKLEHFADSIFVVLKTVAYVDHDQLTATSDIISTGEVMVFLGDCFVVTVRHGTQSPLAAVRDRLEKIRTACWPTGPARCCGASPTRWWTTTWRSARSSRRTSTRSKVPSSRLVEAGTPLASTS